MIKKSTFQKKLRNAVLIIAFAFLVAGCGGSGGGSDSGSTGSHSLSGQVQKGPLIFGSSVWVSELDTNLNPNGKMYIGQTNDDLGNFVIGSNIGSNLIELLGVGYYMDELTGGLSTSTITLWAVADLTVHPTPIINILTTLQEPRLKTLILGGQTYQAAMQQSQSEVLAAFGIDVAKILSFRSLYAMQINGTTDQDSVLLATSAILSKMATNSAIANGSSQAAELTYYLNRIASDIQNTGTLSNPSIIAARNLAATQLDLAAVRSNVETYYANRGVIVVAPKFEEWVDKDASGVLPRRLVPAMGLSFTDASGVEPQQLITSNTIAVSGLGTDVAAPVTVSAGTTIIKNGTDVTGTTTTAIDGDTIALRVTSMGYGLTNSSTIAVGTSSATWRVTTKPLGGTLRMLTGTGLVLQNNGGDDITIPAGSTSFNFNATVANGASYNVSVLTQPTNPAQVCTVANGTGTVGAAPSNVIVSCAGPVSGLGYTDVTGVDPNQAITSNAITVSGLGASIVATVTADANTTIIKNGTAVTGTTTTAIDGDTIALRVTSMGYGLTNSSTIAIASSSATWRVVTKPLGGTISGLTSTGLVLQNNSGDDITIPAGSTSFNFNATVANGASYNVSVLTQPTSPLQDCTVTNGTGTVGAAVSSISVVCSAAEIAYVTHGNSNTVSAHIINATTGVWASIGTFVAGTSLYSMAVSIAVDPTGKFAYVTNGSSGTVSAFSINANGALISIGTIVVAENYAEHIAVDPTGKFAYVTVRNAGSDNVSAYSINATTGALTSIGMVVAGTDPRTEPQSIIVDPTGKFAYVANSYSNNVSAFSINATTGVLTSIGTFTAGTYPYGIAVDPTGKFAYVGNGYSNNVSAFSINATTGALTSISTISAGTAPYHIAVDPTGKFAYVANISSGTVSAFSINATTGVLTSIGTFTAGTRPYGIAVDPTGKFAYVTNEVTAPATISAFSINATTGVLTSIGTIAATVTNPADITIIRAP